MDILGISCFYHDAAAALLRDGVPVAAAAEERFSRRKHDAGFPRGAVDFCLTSGGIGPGELDHVVFYEKPFRKFERIVRSSLRTFPRSRKSFSRGMLAWMGEKLWVEDRIREELGVERDRILFTDHHDAHAASAFHSSPFDEAALLTVDGVGEWTTAALGTARRLPGAGGRTDLRLSRRMRFPHSLGLLYSTFTAWLGFRVNNGEYKVMGMAPYGEPRHVDRVRELLRVHDDGSFELDLDYFAFHRSADRSFSPKFVELFGPPREPETPFLTRRDQAGADELDGAALERNRYYADVAASVQRVTEERLLAMARRLHAETGLDRLCMAGGVALNSVANGRILQEGPFREVFIQPAAGDAGGALGAAQYVWHQVLGHPPGYAMEHAYLGRGHGDGELRDFLDARGAGAETFGDEAELVERITDDLVDGRVVAHFDGRFEWGPRALGNRSILADPRSAAMKDVVNTKIKFREPFRPFAPVVPDAEVPRLFRMEKPGPHHPARFMLVVRPWRDGAGERARACSHGGTGRLQAVGREHSRRYHDLVRSFGDATGVPVLLNTSFNLRGEPMVASPADAWKTFTESGIDVLVLGRHVVRK